LQLAEIGLFQDEVSTTTIAPISARSSHDLREAKGFGDCLDPDSYVQSQALAERLLASGSLGVVYGSVRRRGGTCLACFRPALVMNVRRGASFRFRWNGSPRPEIRRG